MGTYEDLSVFSLNHGVIVVGTNHIRINYKSLKGDLFLQDTKGQLLKKLFGCSMHTASPGPLCDKLKKGVFGTNFYKHTILVKGNDKWDLAKAKSMFKGKGKQQASPKQASPKQASPKQASPKQASPKQASPKASPKQASPKASPKASPQASPAKKQQAKKRKHNDNDSDNDMLYVAFTAPAKKLRAAMLTHLDSDKLRQLCSGAGIDHARIKKPKTLQKKMLLHLEGTGKC